VVGAAVAVALVVSTRRPRRCSPAVPAAAALLRPQLVGAVGAADAAAERLETPHSIRSVASGR
jgi:hypothetical protein